MRSYVSLALASWKEWMPGLFVFGCVCECRQFNISFQPILGRNIVLETMCWLFIGVGGAAALKVATKALRRYIMARRLARQSRSAFFFALYFSFACFGGVLFRQGDIGPGLAFIAFSSIFIWASLGNAYEWPGFRPKPFLYDRNERELYSDEVVEWYDDELDSWPRFQ